MTTHGWARCAVIAVATPVALLSGDVPAAADSAPQLRAALSAKPATIAVPHRVAAPGPRRMPGAATAGATYTAVFGR